MNARTLLRSLAPLLLCALSGVLLALAMPPRDISFLGWFAIAPLLVACRRTRSPLTAAGCGIVTAAICGGVLAGRPETPQQLGNMAGAFGGLALVLAFVAGFGRWTANRMNPLLWPLFIACAGVTAEMLSVFVFPVNLALTQHTTPGALALASYTGIWGVSFALWFVSATVSGPKLALPMLLAAAVLVAGMQFARLPQESGTRLAVAAIQAPDPYNAFDETLKVPSGTRIVVWPEHTMHPDQKQPFSAAKKKELYVVASFLRPANATKPYNTACVIGPDGAMLGEFRKQRLFGVEKYGCSVGEHRRPLKCDGFMAGPAICFDTQATGVIRRLVRDGADIVFVGSNDPEAPNAAFNHLHTATVAFRAAENGVPIVSAECACMSTVFDGHGKVLAQSREHANAVVFANATLRRGTTVFTRTGDWFAYLCAAAMALWVVLCVRARRREALPDAGYDSRRT